MWAEPLLRVSYLGPSPNTTYPSSSLKSLTWRNYIRFPETALNVFYAVKVLFTSENLTESPKPRNRKRRKNVPKNLVN